MKFVCYTDWDQLTESAAKMGSDSNKSNVEVKNEG